MHLRNQALALFASLVMSGLAQAQIYFRADVGYSDSTGADFTHNNLPATNQLCTTFQCGRPQGGISEVGDSSIFGAGIGWRFTPSIRTDATITYRGGYGANQQLTTGAFPSTLSLDVKSWNVMANAYYDVPLGSATPYVAGGIGWARNEISDVTWTVRAIQCGVCGPTTVDIAQKAPGGTRSGFAWSLGAGIGIRLHGDLTLDISGRYVDLGRISTDAGTLTLNGVPIGAYPGASGYLRAWEILIGLRF